MEVEVEELVEVEGDGLAPFEVDDDFELFRIPAFVPVSCWPSATAVRAVSKTLPKGAPLLPGPSLEAPPPGGAALCAVLTGGGGATDAVMRLASRVRYRRSRRACSARPWLPRACARRGPWP